MNGEAMENLPPLLPPRFEKSLIKHNIKVMKGLISGPYKPPPPQPPVRPGLAQSRPLSFHDSK